MTNVALPSLSRMNPHKLNDAISDDGLSEDLERESVSGVGGWSTYDISADTTIEVAPEPFHKKIRHFVNDLKISCRLRELSIQFSSLGQLYFLPWSILLLTFIQILVYYAAPQHGIGLAVRLPLVPGEEYKLITCILAHVDRFHLWGNLLIQVIVGVVIELTEGTLRTQLIYWLSGLAASLSEAALFEPTTSKPFTQLLGASGAIYALLLIGLSGTIMNFKETWGAWCIVLIYLIAIGFETYVSIESTATNVAFAAHAFGALYGFVLGLIFVRNIHITTCERAITFISTTFILGCSAVLIYLGLSNYA